WIRSGGWSVHSARWRIFRASVERSLAAIDQRSAELQRISDLLRAAGTVFCAAVLCSAEQLDWQFPGLRANGSLFVTPGPQFHLEQPCNVARRSKPQRSDRNSGSGAGPTEFWAECFFAHIGTEL